MQTHFNDTLGDLLIETPSCMAVAVSGGADSFALLHLTMQWAAEKNIAVHAFTVDHRLRLESTQEAEIVGEWCARHHIDHTILPWTEKKPETGLQDAARNKRRALLFNACRERNIPVLLMGHQADDQAETLLMRLQRGSGLLGMTGIQAYTYDHATDVSLIRPLLKIRRHTLRDYAAEFHLPFIDDPSNENPVFERAALRQILTHLPDLADGVVKTVERLTRADWALMAIATDYFQKNNQIVETGIWLPAELLSLEEEVAQRVLEEALYGIDADADVPLAGLEHLLHKMKLDDFNGQTLAQCAIRPKVWKKQKGYLFELAPPRHS